MAAAGGAGSIRREVLDRSSRTKINTTDDYGWYSQPRLCTHVDDEVLSQLTELYRQRIPAGGTVMDMCSSHVSHLPPEVEYSEVVGHGMNVEELGRNPRLNRSGHRAIHFVSINHLDSSTRLHRLYRSICLSPPKR